MTATNTAPLFNVQGIGQDAKRLQPTARAVSRFLTHYFGMDLKPLQLELVVEGLSAASIATLQAAYTARALVAQQELSAVGIKLSAPVLGETHSYLHGKHKALQFKLDISEAKLETLSDRKKVLDCFVGLKKQLWPREFVDYSKYDLYTEVPIFRIMMARAPHFLTLPWVIWGTDRLQASSGYLEEFRSQEEAEAYLQEMLAVNPERFIVEVLNRTESEAA